MEGVSVGIWYKERHWSGGNTDLSSPYVGHLIVMKKMHLSGHFPAHIEVNLLLMELTLFYRDMNVRENIPLSDVTLIQHLHSSVPQLHTAQFINCST
jgi:hypothetical protein